MVNINLYLRRDILPPSVLVLSNRVLNITLIEAVHVFVCFIDFSKAFDKVNYWTLFKQLLDDDVSRSIVTLLAFWYSHQQASVIWLMPNTRSKSFCIGNGILSKGVFYLHICLRGTFDYSCR